MPRGPPQVLAAGSREHVATDFLHIDRHLSDPLAGIQQKQYAGSAGQGANLFDRLHGTAVGGDHRQGDQRDAFVLEHCFQCRQ